MERGPGITVKRIPPMQIKSFNSMNKMPVIAFLFSKLSLLKKLEIKMLIIFYLGSLVDRINMPNYHFYEYSIKKLQMLILVNPAIYKFPPIFNLFKYFVPPPQKEKKSFFNY